MFFCKALHLMSLRTGEEGATTLLSNISHYYYKLLIHAFIISQLTFTYSKLRIEALEQWRRSGVFIVNFVVVFLLLTLNL